MRKITVILNIGIGVVFTLFSLSAWFGCETLGRFFFAEGVLTGIALLIILPVNDWERLIK